MQFDPTALSLLRRLLIGALAGFRGSCYLEIETAR